MNSIDTRDPFLDALSNPRRLFGVSLATGSCRLAELAGAIGYEMVWIDMEHGAVSTAHVESLCIAADAGGAIPAVRVSSGSRENILLALEAGARLVIVPMVNSTAEARKIVEYGKFPPLGCRGFNTRSRGVAFGLAGPLDEFCHANRRTHLIAQIESQAAVNDLEAICQVEGLSGILVGPGDLSQDMGKTAQFSDPKLTQAVVTCIEKARSWNKHAGIFTSSPTLLDAAMSAGCDFAFVSIDVAELAQLWSARYFGLRQRFGMETLTS